MRLLRNMKSRIAVLILAIVAANLPVHATVTEEGYSYERGVVTIKLSTDADEKDLSYILTDAVGQNNDQFGGNEFYHMGEVSADTLGIATICLELFESGNYVLRVRDRGGAVYERTIAYVNTADYELSFLPDINSGDKNKISVVLTNMSKGVSYEGTTLDESSGALGFVIENWDKDSTYVSVEEVKAEMQLLWALYRLNTSKAAGIAKAVSDVAVLMNLSSNEYISDFVRSSTDTQKQALVSYISKNKVYDADDLISVVKSVMTTGNKPTGSGGSGGRGSGGGGSLGILTPSEVIVAGEQPEGTAPKTLFNDMEDASWAKEAVESLYAKGIVSGNGDGSFRPNDNITREEFVKLVVLAFGIPYENEVSGFIDVFEKDWFNSYVGGAYKAGIIKGVSADLFGVYRNITRQDAAVMLKRAAEYASMLPTATRSYNGFNDEDSIGDYAIDSVITLFEGDVIDGMPDGSFDPYGDCTRAQAAKMIYKLI